MIQTLLNQFRGVASLEEMRSWADGWLRQNSVRYVRAGMDGESARALMELGPRDEIMEAIASITAFDDHLSQRRTCREKWFEEVYNSVESGVILKPENAQVEEAWTHLFLSWKELGEQPKARHLLSLHNVKHEHTAEFLRHVHDKRFASGHPIADSEVQCIKGICEFAVETVYRSSNLAGFRIHRGVNLEDATSDAFSPELRSMMDHLNNLQREVSVKTPIEYLPIVRKIALLVDEIAEHQRQLVKDS